MTRNAVMLLVVVVLLGVLYFLLADVVHRDADLKTVKENDLTLRSGTLVYALRDIGEGETITADSIDAHEVVQCKIPFGAIPKSSIALGRRPKYGLSRGEIVVRDNLDPPPRTYVQQAVRAAKEVRQGEVFTAEALENCSAAKYEIDGLNKMSMVLGKKAKHKINPGQILENTDFEP